MILNERVMLLHMLKALADDSRLSIVWQLNNTEITVGDLAEKINLGEPTVSHHLARLSEVGLVTLRMAGNQRFYSLNASGLALFKRLAANIEALAPLPEPVVSDNSWIDALGWSAEDAQILRDHTRNGQLTRLPNKQKKTEVVIRWLATKFQPDTLYSEAEVNAILKTVYEPDYVSLRRDLVDFGYLRRERGGGKYWLTPEDNPANT